MKATAVITMVLAETNLPSSERRELEKELDRLPRIRLDYPLTHDALFEKLKASVSGLTREEFEGWIAAKRFDVRMIDGEERFMASSVANLFFRYPELNPRRTPLHEEAAEGDMWENAVAIKQAVKSGHTPYVLPKNFEVTMTVTVASNVVPAGETIRAWLPIPRDYPYQNGYELIASSPKVLQTAPATSPIRSVYMEQAAPTNAPAVFKIVYRYATKGVRFDIDPEKVVPFDGKDAEIAKFTREAPQVVFTPEMRALSKQILGDETNPARQAKKFYDWISKNIQYSFSTEYGTLDNISDYTRTHRYGDCG
ncbi:MAG TPA: transglutaminase-like domain-containing protein, partial [Candidatus Acidoferrales bacterium]|nr:transglutaminase-like domain-containing protein [Candidatus Acidoferrales bacterium]